MSSLPPEPTGHGLQTVNAKPVIEAQRPTTDAGPAKAAGTAFGYPRDFLDNHHVYIVISPRARGLSVGINMNPDKFCNFDCVYCEVDRSKRARARQVNVRAMATELERTLQFVHSGSIHDHPHYEGVPAELLRLRQVCLSGDGEPTLCPNFASAVEAVI